MEDRIGQQLGNYRLIRLLGKGSFSSVYLGEHVHEITQAAVKVLQTQLTSEGLKEFINEARSFRMKHPNIVQLLDFGISTDDSPFLVMDYAPNGTLRQRHPKGTILPLATVITYVKQVAAALQYAHYQRVIHRDVKPENMLLGRHEEVLLSDFGIAIIAHSEHSLGTQNVVGTAPYMALEQLQGRPRPASDQYALAVVVYEWLCGARPFQGTTIELIQQHLFNLPPPLREKMPEISPSVEEVVLKALAKTPEERFESVQTFADALERASKLEQPGQSTSDVTRSFFTTPSQPSAPSLSSIHTQELPLQEASPPTSPASDLTAVRISPLSQWKLSSTGFLGKCPYCGAETRSGDNFCLNCGNHLTSLTSDESYAPWGDPTVEATLVVDKCPHCGTEIGSGDIFCRNCGNRLLPVPYPVDQIQASMIQSLLAESPSLISADAGISPTIQEEQTSDEAPAVSAPESDSAPATPSDPRSTVVSSQTKELLFEEGELHYKAKHYEKSLAIYEQIVQLDPHNVRALLQKGNALRKLRKYKEALIAYNYALKASPDDAPILQAKADVLSRLKRYKEALDVCNHVLTFTLTNAFVWITKGKVLNKLNLYDESLTAYDNAVAIISNDALLWVAKGEVLAKLERYEEALKDFIRAADIAPTRASIWAAKGETLSQLKRYDEALVAYERAYVLNPRDTDLARTCTLLRDLKRHKEELTQAQVKEKPAGLQADQFNTRVFNHNNAAANQRGTQELPRSAPKEQKAYQPFEQQADVTRIVKPFDIFLSHSDTDTEWVEANLANHLEAEHGFHVWLGKWMLVPGQLWQEEMDQAMTRVACCAICIGSQTSLDWFKQELQRVRKHKVQDPSLRVFAVLLPSAKHINPDEFPELNTWVDFRGSDHTYAFHVLVCGVKGIPPGRPQQERTITPTEEKLRELQRWREDRLIDPSIDIEAQRTLVIKVWLNE